jgi:hypothetical protein
MLVPCVREFNTRRKLAAKFLKIFSWHVAMAKSCFYNIFCHKDHQETDRVNTRIVAVPKLRRITEIRDCTEIGQSNLANTN